MAFYENVHGMNDAELNRFVDDAATVTQATQPDFQTTNRLNIGLTELSLRSQQRTRDSIEALRRSIDGFSASSDRSSGTIVFLTRVLIGLTVVLAILATPPGISEYRHLTATTEKETVKAVQPVTEQQLEKRLCENQARTIYEFESQVLLSAPKNTSSRGYRQALNKLQEELKARLNACGLQ